MVVISKLQLILCDCNFNSFWNKNKKIKDACWDWGTTTKEQNSPHCLNPKRFVTNFQNEIEKKNNFQLFV
jgi:hypothetical protein